jgi:hypothetical protein
MKLKRFLVFSGDKYYPAGGWLDLMNSFDTEDAAVGYARGLASDALVWSHVVDSHSEWTMVFDSKETNT